MGSGSSRFEGSISSDCSKEDQKASAYRAAEVQVKVAAGAHHGFAGSPCGGLPGQLRIVRFADASHAAGVDRGVDHRVRCLYAAAGTCCTFFGGIDWPS